MVRRADRRALVVLFETTLKHGTEPRSTASFRVFDVARRRALPLLGSTVVDPVRCPAPAAGPEDRLCLELAGDAQFTDSAWYAVFIDRVEPEGGGDPITPGVIAVPPVGGEVVLAEGAPERRVRIVYTVDLSADSTLEPRILLDGREARITTRRVAGANVPLCYTRGALAFVCDLAAAVRNGQKVTATLVRRTDGADVTAGAIEPATAKYDPPEDPDDARVNLKGGLSRLSGKSTWSVQLATANWALWQWGGGDAWHVTTLGPVTDIVASSDTSDAGSLNLGAQFRSLLFPPGLRVLDIRTTSRGESDKDVNVANWMWADADVRIGIPGLYRGRLPGRGYYSFVPHGGVELGATVSAAADAVRPEDDRPFRLKGGVEGVLAWPKSLLKVPSWLPFAGLRVEGEVRAYRLQSLAAGVADRTPALYRNVALTYKLYPAVGITAGWRRGALPPAFSRSRVFEFGLSALY